MNFNWYFSTISIFMLLSSVLFCGHSFSAPNRSNSYARPPIIDRGLSTSSKPTKKSLPYTTSEDSNKSHWTGKYIDKSEKHYLCVDQVDPTTIGVTLMNNNKVTSMAIKSTKSEFLLTPGQSKELNLAYFIAFIKDNKALYENLHDKKCWVSLIKISNNSISIKDHCGAEDKSNSFDGEYRRTHISRCPDIHQ